MLGSGIYCVPSAARDVRGSPSLCATNPWWFSQGITLDLNRETFIEW